MPINACTVDGKPGLKWGSSGKCYPYTPGDEASKAAAKKKAIAQAVAASYQGGKQVGKVDLSVEMQGIIDKNFPLAVCETCLHEANAFIGGADPLTLPCEKCGGFMRDPAGFQYTPQNYDALKLHYKPWNFGVKKEGIE